MSVSVAGSSQKLLVISNAALGSLATPGNGLEIYVCHQLGAGALTTVGGGMFGLSSAANQRQTFGISAVITGLAAGTYNVGMCGRAGVPANWNNNEWSYTSAMLVP